MPPLVSPSRVARESNAPHNSTTPTPLHEPSTPIESTHMRAEPPSYWPSGAHMQTSYDQLGTSVRPNHEQEYSRGQTVDRGESSNWQTDDLPFWQRLHEQVIIHPSPSVFYSPSPPYSPEPTNDICPTATPLQTKEDFVSTLQPLVPSLNCPICQDPYTEDLGENHMPVKLPTCGHVYGYRCILEWFDQKQRNAHTCPLCRGVLFESGYDSEEEYGETVTTWVDRPAHVQDLADVGNHGIIGLAEHTDDFENLVEEGHFEYEDEIDYTIAADQEEVQERATAVVNTPTGDLLLDLNEGLRRNLRQDVEPSDELEQQQRQAHNGGAEYQPQADLLLRIIREEEGEEEEEVEESREIDEPSTYQLFLAGNVCTCAECNSWISRHSNLEGEEEDETDEAEEAEDVGDEEEDTCRDEQPTTNEHVNYYVYLNQLDPDFDPDEDEDEILADYP